MTKYMKTKLDEFGEPICPICGHTIEIESIDDSEEVAEEDCDYMEFGYGYCWGCGKMYNLNIGYRFAYYEIKVEEDKQSSFLLSKIFVRITYETILAFIFKISIIMLDKERRIKQ